mmetsp:Transcript_44880/g.140689  ORF Transcript_44880/g.140689 Transcript_44880/m.140689 type:complete len:147 (-) Transcript_44880:249-689(-)
MTPAVPAKRKLDAALSILPHVLAISLLLVVRRAVLLEALRDVPAFFLLTYEMLFDPLEDLRLVLALLLVLVVLLGALLYEFLPFSAMWVVLPWAGQGVATCSSARWALTASFAWRGPCKGAPGSTSSTGWPCTPACCVPGRSASTL